MTTKKFLLLDAARIGDLFDSCLASNPNRYCLYSEPVDDALKDVAPWIFDLNSGQEEFLDFVSSNGSGNSWGVILESSNKIEDIKRHLKRFVLVEDDYGKKLYFRFYDPRVLREFLPIANKTQLNEMFQGIEQYILEDEGGKVIGYTYSRRKLEKHDLHEELSDYLNLIMAKK